MALLKVVGLEKSFGTGVYVKHAVRGVSFDVSCGEVLAFLGPNGAGKSTSMRLITGYLEPDAGDAFVCGASISHHKRDAQAALGYLAEGAPLYEDLTARAFLKFLGGSHGLTRTEIRTALERVIEDANIKDVIDRPIETLSKGYKRRVGLAGSLMHDPPVLVLDEPTDGLDPNQKQSVRELIRRISQTKAILISTHQLDEVEAMCDRAVVIDEGRIVANGTPGSLMVDTNADTLETAFRSLTHEERLQ